MALRILLDTNFLLLPVQRGVDIFCELERVIDVPYEVCVLAGVVEELERLCVKGSLEDRKAARVGLELIKSKALKIISSSGEAHIDDLLVEAADRQTIVATQDRELRRRLRARGIRVIGLRQGTHLYVAG